MDCYKDFASMYDLFMDETPYEAWGEWIISRLKEQKIESGLVLDLGCGTGAITEYLAAAGYDMIGLDASAEMLNVALSKKEESGADILYLCQDMREMELYGTVAAVISVCDSINYVTEPGELTEVFRLVNNYLDPEGLFLFDFNTDYKYRECIGDQTIAENREEGSFIWENSYDAESRINEYALTVFRPTEDGLYEKIEELHYQRGYTLSEIKELLKEAGLVFIKAYDGETHEEAGEKSERIYVLARECGKSEQVRN